MEKLKVALMCSIFIIVSMFCGCISSETSETSNQLKNANIKLNVTEESWLEDEKPHDIYKLIKRELEKVGFNVVSNDDKNYNTSINVAYNENEGYDYADSRSSSIPIAHGTDIYCSISLVNKSGKEIFEFDICNSTSHSAKDLHSSAIDNFRKDVESGYMNKIIAMEYLKEEKDPHITDFCFEALNNSAPIVRFYAVFILGQLKDAQALYPLIYILRYDDINEVRVASALALAEIGDKRAIEPLIEALENDTSSNVQANSAIALGMLSDLKALDPLIKSLESDDEGFVRAGAAMALGYLGDARALSPLNETINSSPAESYYDDIYKEAINLIKLNSEIREKQLSRSYPSFEASIYYYSYNPIDSYDLGFIVTKRYLAPYKCASLAFPCFKEGVVRPLGGYVEISQFMDEPSDIIMSPMTKYNVVDGS